MEHFVFRNWNVWYVFVIKLHEIYKFKFMLKKFQKLIIERQSFILKIKCATFKLSDPKSISEAM